jgi:hypothetical protein
MRAIAIIVFIFLIAGCDKKPEDFVFECTVVNSRNSIAVANATVKMFVQRIDGGFNTNYEQVGITNTDASGNFVIEIEKDVFYSYRIDISHAEHFGRSFEINPDDVRFSTAYTETFEMYPKAWVATHLLNQNFSSTATFAIQSDNQDCNECCTGANTIVQGFPIDSVFICPVVGEQQVSIVGNYVDMNGGINQILETAFVQAFDTTTVTVVY